MQVCPSCGEENPPRFRLCGFCGAALAQVATEERRTVTIVFSDLKGSTSLGEALDPEALREVMTRYFDAMTGVLRRHGGTIEKFIGDAIMAVFGLPRLHEDDALRAVRAASEMTMSLATLNEDLERIYGVRLTNRTGVNTGEVVAGDPTSGQRLVTGDAVNVAARLEQAAPANEVLIGELTYRLTRGAVEAEPVEPLELKGKSQRVAAYRLIAARGLEGYQRRIDTALVGRELEMAQLAAAFDVVVSAASCRALTVIAEAGVGKSRLVAEFTNAIAASGVTVIRGRCLPYGEGITFWPLRGAVREAAGIGDDETPDEARRRLAAIMPDPDVIERIASAIGLSTAEFAVGEIAWAARNFFAHLAASGPVCVVFDDIHWAAPTFLDLVENLVEVLDASPVFIMATARHDLLDSREEWGRAPRSELLELYPLAREDVERVIANLLGGGEVAPEIASRVAAAADGNALFIEQLLAMLIDSGSVRREGDRWVAAASLASVEVPPSIQALLASRLNRLGREERSVIDPASVIGLEFATAAVAHLAPEPVRPDVDLHLAAMGRRRLVHARPTDASDDPGYRFSHVLIRDAAYAGLLKRSRATYHEAFVTWADRVNARRDREVEFEELLGYHLEQAYRYLTELGPLDDHGRELALRAEERLAGAGRRALSRGDMPAAANLLERAAALLSANDPQRLELIPDLAEALLESGRFEDADERLAHAISHATAMGDERLRFRSEIVRLLLQLQTGQRPTWSADAMAVTTAAIPVFEAEGDHVGLATAHRLRYAIFGTANRYAEATAAAEEIVAHAALGADARLQRRGAAAYAATAVYGPMPAPDAIARCELLLDESAGDRRTEAIVCGALAQLVAMRGDVDRARSLYRRARGLLIDLNAGVLAAATSTDSGRVEMLAGDLDSAIAELTRDYDALSLMGERFLLSTVGGLLAEAHAEHGDGERAEEVALIVASLAAEDDLDAQALWRGAMARVLAARGAMDEALAHARAAVAIRAQTDAPTLQADAYRALAAVLSAAGRADESFAALDEARRRYEMKGDLVSLAAIDRGLALSSP
jgi:class 3 adenylate cyclase/tetratricopeptide (TPR) repeat protein